MNDALKTEHLILERIQESRGSQQGWPQRFPDLLNMVRATGLIYADEDLKALIDELCKKEVIRIELFDKSSEIFRVFRGNWDDFMRFQPWFKATETTIRRFAELEELRRTEGKLNFPR
jgi:hypothetical protein